MKSNRFSRIVYLLFALLIFAITLSACMGRYTFNPTDVLIAIKEKFTSPQSSSSMQTVLFVVRLPRILAAIAIGSSLALCGIAYQGVFKNPLVSPDLLGVSAGACVGAALAILLGFGLVGRQLLGFVGGILAVIMTAFIPKLLKNTSNMAMVLSGIIINGFLHSLLGLVKFIAKEGSELSSIIFWQMGSLASIRPQELITVLPVFLCASLVIFFLAWKINILSFGHKEAKSLGVDFIKMRTIIVIAVSILTASAVCISGTVGWVGLVIPHLARLFVGADHTKSIPVAMLLGGLFLLVADTIARTLTSLEIPISIITGLFGAPFYAWLLYKQRTVVN